MVRDRLPALERYHGAEMDDFPDLLRNDDENADQVEALQKKVAEIQRRINNVDENIKRLKIKHAEIVAEPANDSRLKKELSDIMGEIRTEATKIRSSIQRIRQEVPKDESSSKTFVSAKHRIKQTQCDLLTKRFADVMNLYNSCQLKYMDECKQRVQRQLAITGRSVTEEQLEEMIESGDTNIFAHKIGIEFAKKTLHDVEARESEVMKLEQGIRELHELFMDLSMLVESQGEVIDDIEKNVIRAEEYVDEGAGKINQAQRYKNKYRKRKIRLIFVAAVVILILAGIIAAAVLLS